MSSQAGIGRSRGDARTREPKRDVSPQVSGWGQPPSPGPALFARDKTQHHNKSPMMLEILAFFVAHYDS